ncbi:MAG TPA: DUF2291 domain-containing protein [Acidothermaceae bacterium]
MLATTPHQPGRPPRGAASRLLLSVLSLGLVAAGASCAKVPGIYVAEKKGASADQNGAFNATAFVAKIWASKVVPSVLAKAADATTVLQAIKADPAAAKKAYGVQATGGSYSFLVKGTGKVLSVDQPGAAGALLVDLAPADGKADLAIAIGPVLFGTAIRDGAGISFGQFTNQIDYAAVATALNSEVRKSVVNGIDAATVAGKTATFVGAFELVDAANIVVTPVRLGIT